MTDDEPNLGKYFDELTINDRKRLEERMEEYRDQLEGQGYEVVVAEGDRGFFAGVLVIDDERGRFGFLEADGSVTWLTGDVGDVGALGSAVAQKPTAALDQEVDGLENADVE